MKKICLYLIMILISTSISAQENHMKFMGISMNENIKTFINKLQQKRFNELEDLGICYMLKGKFAGYNDCNVFVYPSSGNKVKTVAVSLPFADNWTVLYGGYKKIKDMLTEKYGAPGFCREEFDSYTEPEDDNSKYHEAMMERCKYVSEFDRGNGFIKVLIASVQMHCYTNIIYVDIINQKESDNSAMDDL